MPEATSTTRSVAMLREIASRIRKMPEVKVAGGLAGLNIISFSSKSKRRNRVCKPAAMG